MCQNYAVEDGISPIMNTVIFWALCNKKYLYIVYLDHFSSVWIEKVYFVIFLILKFLRTYNLQNTIWYDVKFCCCLNLDFLHITNCLIKIILIIFLFLYFRKNSRKYTQCHFNPCTHQVLNCPNTIQLLLERIIFRHLWIK